MSIDLSSLRTGHSMVLGGTYWATIENIFPHPDETITDLCVVYLPAAGSNFIPMPDPIPVVIPKKDAQIGARGLFLRKGVQVFSPRWKNHSLFEHISKGCIRKVKIRGQESHGLWIPFSALEKEYNNLFGDRASIFQNMENMRCDDLEFWCRTFELIPTGSRPHIRANPEHAQSYP